MTTPNSNTPNGIINDAMHDAGLLGKGQEPTSEDYADYGRRLFDLICYWQTKGLKLWLNVDTPVTLIVNQAKYSFKPSGDVNMAKPLRVLQGYYLYTSSGTRRPITVMSWQEWLTLSTSTQTGPVSQYFVDKQQSSLDVTFWLTPNSSEASSGTAHVLLQTQVTQFTNLTETMNFPQEWRMALRWGLADDICTGQPQAIMDRCQMRAEAYRTALEDWDVEDASTRFTPDNTLLVQGTGRFK